MKALLVCEYREGKLLDSAYELLAFAGALGAEKAMLLVGSEDQAPRFEGRLYLAEAASHGEYDPDLHKKLVLEAVRREEPDYVVFAHSSYGWDLAPRVAAALEASQVSEIVALAHGGFEVCCCNAKMRRVVTPRTAKAVLTLQAGAFAFRGERKGKPSVEKLETPRSPSALEFLGYEAAGQKAVDLAGAAVIVSAGRGVGKKENVALVAALARVLGGELGASRPVVDAGWVDHSRQVGSTGQTVAPKLYVACGISGAVQHLAGMKGAEFIVAVNKDKEAPIAEVADVLVVADLTQLLPALTARLRGDDRRASSERPAA
jgi:electron transfer flavoprotein alpha subunit